MEGVHIHAGAAKLGLHEVRRQSAGIRNFLQQNHAKSISVPYQANRAVIFDSALLHKTNKVRFSEGYGNRRINITLLYGERNNDTPD